MVVEDLYRYRTLVRVENVERALDRNAHIAALFLKQALLARGIRWPSWRFVTAVTSSRTTAATMTAAHRRTTHSSTAHAPASHAATAPRWTSPCAVLTGTVLSTVMLFTGAKLDLDATITCRELLIDRAQALDLIGSQMKLCAFVKQDADGCPRRRR